MDGVMSYMHEFYFESAAMILTLITVGKMLEARSKGKTTDALKSLMSLAPKTATIVRDGVEQEVPVAQVKKGDVFVVRPGENIPVDGIILEGSIPSPANPPKGCKFHTRCRKCMEICKYVQPDFVELEPEHFCACHLYNSPERSKELEAVMQDAIREIEASKNGEKSKKGK